MLNLVGFPFDGRFPFSGAGADFPFVFETEPVLGVLQKG